jgi:hypothetical protein
MIISDINYLEDANQEIVGGYGFTKMNAMKINMVNLTGDSTIIDKFTMPATISIDSNLSGNSSSFTFKNEALGPNTNTQYSLSQEVVPGQRSNLLGFLFAAAN